jgi:hypothetical protein
MNLDELIDELDQRFGNEYAPKHYKSIQQAVEELKKYRNSLKQKEQNENCTGK